MPKMASRVVLAAHRTGQECIFKAVRHICFSNNEYIFECETPGCPGCGCPVFVVDAEDNYPIYILQWLEDHAQMCLGLFPATAPSPN